MNETVLTRRQWEILRFIQGFRQRRGYSPTVRETTERFGLRSVATVAEHLDSLEGKGLIKRQRDRARSVLLTGRGKRVLKPILAPAGKAARRSAPPGSTAIPLMGTIAAGEPIEALPVPEEIEVPPAMVGRRPSYALRVQGDSMIEEGIFDGDYVVVEETHVPENGETVVALLEGREVTLKKFYRERADGGERIRLQPANPAMEPLVVGKDKRIEIQGRVRGVLRIL